MTRDSVILIGPVGAGKTTVSKLVALRLGLRCVHMDDVRIGYYKEIGYSEDEARRLHHEGFHVLYRYWKPFEVHAVERLVAESGSAVLDFGGGHSVQEDNVLLARVVRALAPFPNVVLLLPSTSKAESVRILNERKGSLTSGGIDFHMLFVNHPANYLLAKHIVYTNGRTPAETADEIVALIRPANKSEIPKSNTT